MSSVVRHFSTWCHSLEIGNVRQIQPMHIASYLKTLEREGRAAPSIKLHLTALRSLFNWLVMGHALDMNPAHAVRGPKHVVRKGKTLVLTSEEARKLIDGIVVVTKVTGRNSVVSRVPAIIALRDRALIAVMVFTFARVAAVLRLKVRDYFSQGGRRWIRLHEKNGREDALPVTAIWSAISTNTSPQRALLVIRMVRYIAPPAARPANNTRCGSRTPTA